MRETRTQELLSQAELTGSSIRAIGMGKATTYVAKAYT